MRSVLIGLGIVITALGVGHAASRPSALARERQPTAARTSRRPALFKDSRQAVAMARAQGRTHVVLLVAARQGATNDVARQAAQMGGDVRFRDDEVGYLRVRVPVDRATAFADFDRIEAAAVDVDDSYPIRLDEAETHPAEPSASRESQDDSPHPAESPQAAARPQDEAWPPRLSDYPLRHPYSPLKDLGAADFSGAASDLGWPRRHDRACSTATSTSCCPSSRRPTHSTARPCRRWPTS